MEENVCASLLSLVEDLPDFMVIGSVLAESHPNACPGDSMSTAKMEATFLILLGMMIAIKDTLSMMRPTARYGYLWPADWEDASL